MNRQDDKKRGPSPIGELKHHTQLRGSVERGVVRNSPQTVQLRTDLVRGTALGYKQQGQATIFGTYWFGKINVPHHGHGESMPECVGEVLRACPRHVLRRAAGSCFDQLGVRRIDSIKVPNHCEDTMWTKTKNGETTALQGRLQTGKQCDGGSHLQTGPSAFPPPSSTLFR